MASDLEADGANGVVKLTADGLSIGRKKTFGGIKHVKMIPLKSIGAIQLKPAGSIVSGYFQVAYSGSNESKAGTYAAASDENSVLFVRAQQAAFEAIRDEVLRRQAAPAPGGSPTSAADEIERLAGLRDRGLLSEQEFQAAKRRALGL